MIANKKARLMKDTLEPYCLYFGIYHIQSGRESMSKRKDVDAYLQGELCAKAELATKLLHDIAWSKWTTDAMTARVDPIYKQAREISYWLLNSDDWYTENEDGGE